MLLSTTNSGYPTDERELMFSLVILKQPMSTWALSFVEYICCFVLILQHYAVNFQSTSESNWRFIRIPQKQQIFCYGISPEVGLLFTPANFETLHPTVNKDRRWRRQR
ncbi:uncharacterized protein LOC112906098 [Agrilus planipennis]|uniref:Uncharacterized protein LOC112906098 n=1 Tax=Agrilus planipennis TaxID=224129 RepID=A0A7F5RI48_AGRPL|nr:uncharacterized protein LOC112906098 [Agrilus planipennis]